MTSSNVEKVKELMSRANMTAQQNNVVVDEFAKKVINKVFDELAVIFPAWKNAWPTKKELDMAKLQWTKSFVENGISSLEQIQYGFKKARQAESDFLPSCGKFVSWCCPTPEDMGYPSEERAKHLCVSYRANKKLGVKMHVRPLIVELAKRINWWLIETACSGEEHKRAEKHFKETYLDLIQNYVEPKEIDAPRLETEEKVKYNMSEHQKASSKERGLDHIKNIKQKLKQNKYSGE